MQPDKSDFIIAKIKEVESHKSIEVIGYLLKIVNSKISTNINMGNSRLFYPFVPTGARDPHMEY